MGFTDLSSGPVFLTALPHVSERMLEVWPDQEILCVCDLCLLCANFIGKWSGMVGVVTLLAGVMDRSQLQVFRVWKPGFHDQMLEFRLSFYLPHWSSRLCRKTSF